MLTEEEFYDFHLTTPGLSVMIIKVGSKQCCHGWNGAGGAAGRCGWGHKQAECRRRRQWGLIARCC